MDYLVQHALDNVWCSPRQDRQWRTRPKRVSRNGGEWLRLELNWLNVYLPDNRHYWHVYQIGGIHPDFFGLFPVQNEWVSLQEVCNKEGMIAEFYSIKGVLCPKYHTYYMVTAARNLVIATRRYDNRLPIDYDREDMYFRVYTNKFFQSARSNHLSETVVCGGFTPSFTADILTIQNEYQQYRSKANGYAYAIINGFYYEEISPLTCKVGDLVEWIYDSSVERVVEFEIDHLLNFDSTLDRQRKYFLHYPGQIDRIDYQDDIDMFLVDRRSTKANGLYHHKNSASSMRSLTHKDYSVSVQFINAFVDGHPRWDDPQKLNLMLLIRNGGFDRPLEFENSRIHELYKLNEEDIISAVVGDNAAVPVWQANSLESAGYPRLMRKLYDEVDLPLVQEAYGYNACSVILGDTPKLPYEKNGVRRVDVPMGLYENSTMFEYDSAGVLLGWHHHIVGYEYLINDPDCALVEGIVGLAGQLLDEYYDQWTMPIDPRYNYRMYVSDKISGNVLGNWKDVTDSSMYGIVDGTLTWLISDLNYSVMVRSDKNPYVNIYNVKAPDGLIEFDLTKHVKKNSVVGVHLFDVPMGELDIILNGRSLTPVVDYSINFPKVIIHNKKYLMGIYNGNAQEIVVRFTGFCKPDMTMEPVDDIGFVKYDLMSRNASYNIRDDRVLRIVCDGRVMHRGSLKWSEDDQIYEIPTAHNGDPYCVRDIVVPMRNMTIGDTYSLREASRVIDRSISHYMTVKLPEPVPTAPNVIPELYPVFSPFLSKILYDIETKVIDDTIMKDRYTTEDVFDICRPYEYILEFDPTQMKNKFNEDYMTVHPHAESFVIDIELPHYEFLQRVIDLYMKDLVVLNHWFRLKPIL